MSCLFCSIFQYHPWFLIYRILFLRLQGLSWIKNGVKWQLLIWRLWFMYAALGIIMSIPNSFLYILIQKLRLFNIHLWFRILIWFYSNFILLKKLISGYFWATFNCFWSFSWWHLYTCHRSLLAWIRNSRFLISWCLIIILCSDTNPVHNLITYHCRLLANLSFSIALLGIQIWITYQIIYQNIICLHFDCVGLLEHWLFLLYYINLLFIQWGYAFICDCVVVKVRLVILIKYF